jgi:hypothetical protein
VVHVVCWPQPDILITSAVLHCTVVVVLYCDSQEVHGCVRHMACFICMPCFNNSVMLCWTDSLTQCCPVLTLLLLLQVAEHCACDGDGTQEFHTNLNDAV